MDKILINAKCKQLMITLAFGIAAGCIYFNILWRIQGNIFHNEWSILFDYLNHMSLRKMMNMVLKFWHVSLLFHLSVCLLGATKLGKITIQGMVLCSGVLIGVLQTLLILSFDLKSGSIFLLKILIILFPYSIFVGSMTVIGYAMSSLRWNFENKTKKWRIIQWKKYIFCTVSTLIIHLVYIIFVSYVNFEKINFGFF